MPDGTFSGRSARSAPKRTLTLEFLGTGTSTGVPVAGCPCRRCRSRDPRDKRLRSSVLIRNGKSEQNGGRRNLIIDTGPDFRTQCLRARVASLDAVLITHNHVDHLYGLDDVRPYTSFRGKTLPVWGSAHTLASIRSKFDYIWNPIQIGGGLPDISLHEAAEPFTAAGLHITPLPIMHGKLPILGYRIGDLAYMTDISAIPDATLPLLENLGTMIISCVRRCNHPTHLNLAGVRRLHGLIRPKRTYLTHLTHYFTHREIAALFPSVIVPAYDGLTIPIRL